MSLSAFWPKTEIATRPNASPNATTTTTETNKRLYLENESFQRGENATIQFAMSNSIVSNDNLEVENLVTTTTTTTTTNKSLYLGNEASESHAGNANRLVATNSVCSDNNPMTQNFPATAPISMPPVTIGTTTTTTFESPYLENEASEDRGSNGVRTVTTNPTSINDNPAIQKFPAPTTTGITTPVGEFFAEMADRHSLWFRKIRSFFYIKLFFYRF